jgi:pimeloyl-ACP methyl ester carboxylesterase
LPELARDRRVIALDLPGTGNSDRPPPSEADGYSPPWLARQVDSLLSALRVEQVDVVGHGLGAAVAVLLPAERVQRFVLIAPICFSLEPQFRPGLRAPVLGKLLFGRSLRKSEFREFVERQYSTPELLSKRRFDVYWDRVSRDGGVEALFAMEQQMTEIGALADSFRAIDRPTVVVWGDRDRMVPFEDAERATALVPGATLSVVDGCGHAPQEERPVELTRRLREHCAD